jgi:hypothetical protein
MNGFRRAATWALWVAACLATVGCATTPEQRIAREPALFATFAPEAQAKIRQGQADIGFTPDMVRLALGGPSRVYARKTAEGETEIWAYTTLIWEPDTQLVPVDRYLRDRHGRTRIVTDWVCVDTDRRREATHLRVEFRDGKVAAIERPMLGGARYRHPPPVPPATE